MLQSTGLVSPGGTSIIMSVTGIVLFSILMVAADGLARPRPEDPERIETFLTSVRQGTSRLEGEAAVVSRLFDALCSLFQAEIAYYYRRRVIGRRNSLVPDG